jgi:hypothetical protein
MVIPPRLMALPDTKISTTKCGVCEGNGTQLVAVKSHRSRDGDFSQLFLEKSTFPLDKA